VPQSWCTTSYLGTWLPQPACTPACFHLAEHWPEPLAYRPERFLGGRDGEEARSRHPLAHMPFGWVYAWSGAAVAIIASVGLKGQTGRCRATSPPHARSLGCGQPIIVRAHPCRAVSTVVDARVNARARRAGPRLCIGYKLAMQVRAARSVHRAPTAPLPAWTKHSNPPAHPPRLIAPPALRADACSSCFADAHADPA
jgi:hypothetical protein